MKTYTDKTMIARLNDMAEQILTPDSEGKAFFEAVANRLQFLSNAMSGLIENTLPMLDAAKRQQPPIDNAHVAPGCEKFVAGKQEPVKCSGASVGSTPRLPANLGKTG